MWVNTLAASALWGRELTGQPAQHKMDSTIEDYLRLTSGLHTFVYVHMYVHTREQAHIAHTYTK